MTTLFRKPEVPATPTPEPPPTMPDPNSPAVLAEKKKAMQQDQRGGRQSTILTTAADRAGKTLAGGVGSSKLGGA